MTAQVLIPCNHNDLQHVGCSLKEKGSKWGKCQGRGGMCVSLINLSVVIKTGNCWQSRTEGELFEGGKCWDWLIL